MTEMYDANIAALRMQLQMRNDLLRLGLDGVRNKRSEYAEDYRRLLRVYAALIRKFETEVAFEQNYRSNQQRTQET